MYKKKVQELLEGNQNASFNKTRLSELEDIQEVDETNQLLYNLGKEVTFRIHDTILHSNTKPLFIFDNLFMKLHTL